MVKILDNMPRAVHFPRILMILLSLPLMIFVPAAAVSTGVTPLDKGISLVSGLFDIRAFENSMVQEGFLKMMIFIVLFAVSYRALQIQQKGIFSGDQGKKTSIVVSFAFSMIGVFLMPTKWLMITGGAITAIMSSVIFIIIFWGGAFLAVKTLSSSGKDDKFGWTKNLMGFLLILLLLMLLDVWIVFTGLPKAGIIPMS
jgi:hypothetical protein